MLKHTAPKTPSAEEIQSAIAEWLEAARKYRNANRIGQYQAAMEEARKWQGKLGEAA